MRRVLGAYAIGKAGLGNGKASASVIAVTSSVEQVFVILGKLTQEFGSSSETVPVESAEPELTA